MSLRHPSSTRPAALLPYPTRFRSAVATNPAGVHRRPSGGAPSGDAYEAEESGSVAAVAEDILDSPTAPLALDLAPARAAGMLYPIEIAQIGRASCRERVCQYV